MTDLPAVLVWGLKATPLLLAAWLITALLRRTSAATRHLVWIVALSGALGLPAASLVAPRWEVRVLPPISGARRETAPVGNPVQPVVAEPPSARRPSHRETAEAARPAEAGAAAEVPPWPALSVSPTGLWLAGMLLVGILLVVSLARTARVTAAAPPIAGGPIADEARAVARQLGIQQDVRIRVGTDDTMPMTWGAFHPSVLLPAGFAQWPAARRRAVLVHELAHVQRWDWTTQLVAQIACAIYWWHPLSWLAARRLREERELACDDVVLVHGTSASSYANDLLEIARGYRARPALGAVAMARRSQLAGRLLAVLDGARARGRVARRQAVPAAGIGLAVVLPLAGAVAGHVALEVNPPASPVTPSPSAAAASTRATVVAFPDLPPSPLPRAQQRSATLCDWSTRGGRSNSASTNIDDDRMMIQVARDDCTISVRAQGEITFAATDRDIERLAPNGYVEIEERLGRSRRRVEVTDADGGLTRRWYVDGAERPFGDDARAWLGDAILVLFRRAGLDADARALRIFRQGGSDALIAEIALMQSDWAASRYFAVLFERADLTPNQQVTLLQDAGRRIDSDHALGQVLIALASRGPLGSDVQQAYVAAGGSIKSDHELGQVLAALAEKSDLTTDALNDMLVSAGRMESSYQRATLLLAIAQRYPPDRPLPAAYLDAVGGMDSDHERGRVLVRLLERDRLPAADRAQALKVVSRIDSDHTRTQVLLAVLANGPVDAVTRAPFFAAVKGMDSDYSCEQVLREVLRGPPDEANTIAVLDAASQIDSDHSKAEVLVAVAANGRMTEPVRSAYVSVAQTIQSTYERERVMRAAGLRGT